MRRLTTLAIAGAILAAAAPALAAPATIGIDEVPGLEQPLASIEPAVVDPATAPVVVDPGLIPEPVAPAPIDPEPPVLIDPVEPVPLPGVGGLPLQGDVVLPGEVVPQVLFSLFWDLEDPAHVQLWAWWNDGPVPVCDGRVVEGPVFVGRSDLFGGTCLLAQTPGGDFALFVLGDQGGWAFALLGAADQVPPVEPLG